ncbi:hypothetical protein [Candidatus Accumulibacter sp. ACC003]|uniref:hypothetical protein n=1 Tax=Candidatus Accumulibacter sp. ACC003 TaxID=2823334 RepID=UPI0025B888A1|nr:hypothetical protein [Candidatus Accumulibacter sp. ACC003]
MLAIFVGRKRDQADRIGRGSRCVAPVLLNLIAKWASDDPRQARSDSSGSPCGFFERRLPGQARRSHRIDTRHRYVFSVVGTDSGYRGSHIGALHRPPAEHVLADALSWPAICTHTFQI